MTKDEQIVITDPSVTLNSLMINPSRQLFPFCIVWTPIPLLTWIVPIIGHMGIATSDGIIHDFAGSYFIGEGNMAFGRPAKYWQLKPQLSNGGIQIWDNGVQTASGIYRNRIHNLFCDNCHSHVATALNTMRYDGKSNWNMIRLAFLMLAHGKYVNVKSYFITWFPFICLWTIVIVCIYFV